MKRAVWAVAAAGTMVLAACGGGEVVVQAQTENANGQVRPLSNLEVRALPYDRDVVFDSLGQAYGTPEPEIPAELSALRDSMAQAQQAWRQAEARWNMGRDSLRELREELDALSRASSDYIVMFNRFNDLEAEVSAAERVSTEQFSRYEEFQQRYNQRAEEVQREREQWGDAAYADVDRVLAERLEASRRGMVVDTTDENGVARLTGLDAGEWWIHARYQLPFEELYWNMPVTVNDDQVQVQLTRETAEVRPRL